MAYWLCIANSENWEVIKKENAWGVADRHKNTISKVKPGDKLVIYGIQEKIGKDEVLEPRIYGIFEAVSEVYKDSKRIFKSRAGESFPYRVKLKPVIIPEKPLEFKPLIDRLEFIKNKKRWNTHLFGRAMRELPEKDYKLIEKMLRS
ncbi:MULTISPECIES: EVE domain-containing protein [Archaeoglobus]|uniref:UPF0310 protein XD40_0368 n=1 Tax=Archaeoglobus fulgidus TaxID=2234 RepID=A0A124FC31_ARCFL|nr:MULTISPECIES: EVE domain-containing protein [Archaeoglobus]KUJ94432.1 MAG: hypothetical protein XD40_0368 [Archaeoglobus fulgidus]KUK07374.1 MAG: Uncharacterized protein conserved in archaea [Archaeoglobus fulgidus]MDI3496661.1 hypothetical protein [Archaeoglobus sp.]